MTASAILRPFALLAALSFATGAMASPGLAGIETSLSHDAWGGAAFEGKAHTPEPLLLAQADCSAAAAQAAAQTGGEVLSVQASDQGGQTVCVVTVLIPGQGGERPRRTTITLPG